ncbi:hypothetical protein Gohar_000085 [Gossypium harknessii]|uniref:Zinc knuckle CX2CX4HX4C domain-containing protein n=1 Tax=Gossypium harknessii TaxID=34285 RepID=A0A7J9IAB9_9ROSI|nr:hypothetical protein [Gossypium harknessii]
MESEFAGLSLDDEEEEILQAQGDSDSVNNEEFLSLVGCFLTASIIHYPTMKSTMANLWHSAKGVQIRDLGEKRGEDPLKVPLISSPFWVQIHDVPIGFYSYNLAMQLGKFIGIFQEYDGSSLGKENMNFMPIRVQVDIRHPLKRKKQVMFKNKCSYVRFKYERLTPFFYFYCGRLGHNDSFCEAKMEAGVEVDMMGWDLSLRAQSRRAQAMRSVWLREEGGSGGGMGKRGEFKGNNEWGSVGNFEESVDPILGFNLEGKRFSSRLERVRSLTVNSQMAMEHDLENEMIVGEERKKRARKDIEDGSEMEWRNRRLHGINHLLLAAAKRQADRSQ